METIMSKVRNLTIKFFEYAVLIFMVLGILISIVVGIGYIASPYMPGWMGLMIMIIGPVGCIASAGASFLLVGIYHNTKKS